MPPHVLFSLVAASNAAVALAVKVRDHPEASTVRYEAGLYIVLAVYIAPLMVFAALHTLDAIGIRVSVQATHSPPLPSPPLPFPSPPPSSVCDLSGVLWHEASFLLASVLRPF